MKKGRPYGYARLGKGVFLLSASCVAEDDHFQVTDWIQRQGHLWWKCVNRGSRKSRCPLPLEITVEANNIKWVENAARFHSLEIPKTNPDADFADEREWQWQFNVKRDGMETVTTVPVNAGVPEWKLFSTFLVRKKAGKRRSVPLAKETDTQELGGIEQNVRSKLNKWLGSDRASAAIVFTDIVGSVKLGNELGNEEMEKARNAHFTQADTMTLGQTSPGFRVKGLGDGLLVLFHDAISALEFAVSLVSNSGHERVVVRVGIHTGLVDVRTDDVFGTAVNYAARVCQHCLGTGIWVSEEVKKQIEEVKGKDKLSGKWKRHSKCRLKGLPGKRTLWEWRMQGI